MPITPLPPETVRTIGSTQVLPNPTALVKELVENALDAKATSVFVEISANTLDAIQVRDNGHGIAPQDRCLICKRNCTSKIKNLEDLDRIGGSSFGFRGEALASAAEISESVTVSTRIEGEPTAVSMKFNRQGTIET